MATPSEQSLDEALDELKQAFSAPVVPGELEQWASVIAAAAEHVKASLAEQIETVHPDLYNSIAIDDAELLSHVERMQKEDQELLVDTEQLSSEAERLKTAAAAVEPRENVLDEAVEGLRDQALALFARVSKQEAAISTWLQESTQRDRGRVD